MQILIVSQYYYPEPVEKIHDLARGFFRLGHKVTVLTGNPCYPKGAFYRDYKSNLIRFESLEGVKIVRIPQFPDHSRSPIRRAAYYLSFAISASFFGSLLTKRPDVILVYLAALPVGISGWFLSKVLMVPFVLDVVDLWPESVKSSGMLRNAFAEKILRRTARFVYKRARYIAAVTDGFKKNIEKRGIDKNKIFIINNWMPTETYLRGKKKIRKPLLTVKNLKHKFIAMYAGNIGPYQNVGTIIDAAAILKNNKKILFVIVGDGVEYQELVKYSKNSDIRNILFLGRRKPEEMPKLFSLADVLIVHLVPGVLADISIPSKTYAYMASEKPVLMAVNGEAEKFVKEIGFGISIPPSDPQAMAEAIVRLAKMTQRERNQMGVLGKENYRKYYSGEVQIKKFERILDCAVNETSSDIRLV